MYLCIPFSIMFIYIYILKSNADGWAAVVQVAVEAVVSVLFILFCFG